MKLLLISFLALSGFAEVRVTETLTYQEIFPMVERLGELYGNSKVLLVFDIDDTLLVIDDCEGENNQLITGFAKLFSCPSLHAEEGLANKLQSFQNSGFASMALTARGENLVNASQKELSRKHGSTAIFDFDSKPFDQEIKPLLVPKTKRCKSQETPPCLSGEISTSALFTKGVLYASGLHKGLALKSFLDQVSQDYKAVIYVDDRKNNTSNVFDAFKDTEMTMEIFLYLRHRQEWFIAGGLNDNYRYLKNSIIS